MGLQQKKAARSLERPESGWTNGFTSPLEGSLIPQLLPDHSSAVYQRSRTEKSWGMLQSPQQLPEPEEPRVLCCRSSPSSPGTLLVELRLNFKPLLPLVRPTPLPHREAAVGRDKLPRVGKSPNWSSSLSFPT